MSNITQDLFAAIDTIIQKRMNEMSFDTTIVGEVKEKKTDHYIVQHGNTAYIAYALNNESYLVDDQVYITIPQGDYNAKKIIVGKVSDNEKVVDQSFLWPVDSIVDIGNQGITMEESELEGITSQGIYKPQNINNSLLGTRVLGVRATFQTNLSNASSENSYGLAFLINGQIFGVLDSSEFYNNPFMYLNGYTVEKVIELPYNTSWPDITVQFYKRLDNTADPAKIDCTYLNLTLGLKTLVDEENKEITAPKLKLYLNDNQSVDYFSSDKEYKKTINSIFIENKKGYYTGKSLPSGYEIKYFEYKSGYRTDDILAGPNWKHLKKFDSLMSNIEYTIGTDDRITQRNEYRVKAIIKNGETLVAEDIVVFKNIDGGKTDETLGQPNNNDLLIAINGDINHNGVFNVYDSKNCYADDLSKQVINFKVVYADGSSIGENDIIEWTFPQDLNQLSIALPTEKPYEQQSYVASLNSYYTPGERDTIIKCKVIKDGITYYASKVLVFGYKQSQGTSYRLNVKAYRNGEVARNIMYGQKDRLDLVPELRDEWGNLLDISNFVFEWVHKDQNSSWSIDINTFSIVLNNSEENNNLGCPIVKIRTEEPIGLDNGLQVQFETYFPIIWVENEKYLETYMDGATDIVIGQMGGYTYNNENYAIYNVPKENNVIPELIPDIITSPESLLIISTDKKRLQINGKLTPLAYALLVWKKASGGQIVWRQPMLITQSAYENDILNSWNGSQQINDNGNYILSSMLGAGTKDSSNRFTGFMMGKVRFQSGGPGNENIENKIGLFGFKESKRTFEVDENGNAYFEGDIVANSLDLGNIKISSNNLEDANKFLETPTLQAVINENGTIGTVPADLSTMPSNTVGISISKTGLLKANNAIIYGTIYASAGLIGGWEINSERLGSWNNKIGKLQESFYIDSSSGGSQHWIRAYGENNNEVTFSVSKKGILTAKGANITGTITATTLILEGEAATEAENFQQGIQNAIGVATDTATEAKNTATNAEQAAADAKNAASEASKSLSQTQLDQLELDRFYIVGDQIYDNTQANSFDEALKKGSTCFTVSKEGYIQAANAIIKGTIYAGAGLIGGWDINSSRIGSWTNDQAKTKKAIYIASANDKTGYWLRAFNDKGSIVFGVSKAGQLTATGANITGTLNADAGRIGGWSIDDKGYFYSTATGTGVKNTYFYGRGNGTGTINDTSLTNLVMRVGPDNAEATFGITSTGRIYGKNVNLSGKITATEGKIGNLSIIGNTLRFPSVIYDPYETNDGTFQYIETEQGFSDKGFYRIDYIKDQESNNIEDKTSLSIQVWALIEMLLRLGTKTGIQYKDLIKVGAL